MLYELLKELASLLLRSLYLAVFIQWASQWTIKANPAYLSAYIASVVMGFLSFWCQIILVLLGIRISPFESVFISFTYMPFIYGLCLHTPEHGSIGTQKGVWVTIGHAIIMAGLYGLLTLYSTFIEA